MIKGNLFHDMNTVGRHPGGQLESSSNDDALKNFVIVNEKLQDVLAWTQQETWRISGSLLTLIRQEPWIVGPLIDSPKLDPCTGMVICKGTKGS